MKRMVELSHPTLELDQLGDLVSAGRRLHPDFLSNTQKYCFSEDKLFVKVKPDRDRKWLEETLNADLTTEIKRKGEMTLEEKMDSYSREFRKKLNNEISTGEEEDSTSTETKEEIKQKVKGIKVEKLWGDRACPGYKRVRNWIKRMTERPREEEEESTEIVVTEDDDACSDDHSEGCLSFRNDGEEERIFTDDTFLDGVQYAFYMTFFNDQPGKMGRVYTDPAIVFRMYLSKYLHSDKERERAYVILNKAPLEKTKFCKTARTFLTAMREGNADVTPTKKDFVRLYQGLKEPKEIVKLELEKEGKTQLRTGNLQEIIKLWSDKPNYRSVKTCTSLIDTPDEKSSESDFEEDNATKFSQENMWKNNFKRSMNVANKYGIKKCNDVMKYHNYLQKVDVTLKGNDIILLCFFNSLHYAGKLRHDDIEDLIDAAEKYAKKSGDPTKSYNNVTNVVIPLIKDLLEERKMVEGREEERDKEKDLEKLEKTLENCLSYSQVQKEGLKDGDTCPERTEHFAYKTDNNSRIMEDILVLNKKKGYKENHKIYFTINELRKYASLGYNDKFCSKLLKYNQKFEVLVCKKNKKVYPLPKFYMYGRWAKYTDDELKFFLKTQDINNKKYDYIIQCGFYVLKGQEKVMKKCLLSLKILGIKKKDLKLALLLYAKIQFKDSKEGKYDELIYLREKFKILNDVWTIKMRMKLLQEKIMRCNEIKHESWLTNDPDYQMKTFASSKKKRRKKYESFFSSKLVIKEKQDKTNMEAKDDLDDYRYYNYNYDHNFTKSNDYSSEEGDENEDHYLDNLCSCGMAKEQCNLSESPKRAMRLQIEYHYGNNKESQKTNATNNGEAQPVSDIKITGFYGETKLLRGTRHDKLPKIDFISRDSMLQLHSVFDHGIDNFNRDHVVQVVDFIKAMDEGDGRELPLKFQESVDVGNCQEKLTVQEKFKTTKVSHKTNVENPIDKNSLEIAEELLKTEYFDSNEMPQQEQILASEQVLPVKYLERVFQHIQQFP